MTEICSAAGVVLRDAGDNREKDLTFCPAQDAESAASAKEFAATVALLHLTPDLPMERKFPEPYRTTWLQSLAAKAEEEKAARKAAKGKGKGKDSAKAKAEPKSKAKGASSTPEQTEDENAGASSSRQTFGGPSAVTLTSDRKFASKAEGDAFRREKQETRDRKRNMREARNMANPNFPILLAKRMRLMIEEALDLHPKGNNSNNDDNEEFDDLSDAQIEVIRKCEEYGFDENTIVKALNSAQSKGIQDDQLQQKVLEWLLLYVPESELPERFNADRGQFKVLTHKTENSAKTKTAEESKKFPEKSRDELLEEFRNWLRNLFMKHALMDEFDAETLSSCCEVVLDGDEDDAPQQPPGWMFYKVS